MRPCAVLRQSDAKVGDLVPANIFRISRAGEHYFEGGITCQGSVDAFYDHTPDISCRSPLFFTVDGYISGENGLPI
jgi:hypothetical protein